MNPHALAGTSPSSWRVCLFRHSDARRHLSSAARNGRILIVPSREIDDYLAALDEPKRGTLEELRRTILEHLPDAEQGLSYGLPAFRVRGTVVAGFAAFTHHLSYLPQSGSVFPELRNDLAGYRFSSGALRFPVDEPLPTALVAKLLDVRVRQAFGE